MVLFDLWSFKVLIFSFLLARTPTYDIWLHYTEDLDVQKSHNCLWTLSILQPWTFQYTELCWIGQISYLFVLAYNELWNQSSENMFTWKAQCSLSFNHRPARTAKFSTSSWSHEKFDSSFTRTKTFIHPGMWYSSENLPTACLTSQFSILEERKFLILIWFKGWSDLLKREINDSKPTNVSCFWNCEACFTICASCKLQFAARHHFFL